MDLDETHGKILTHGQCAMSNGVYLATIKNTIIKYFDSGIDSLTTFKRSINIV